MSGKRSCAAAGCFLCSFFLMLSSSAFSASASAETAEQDTVKEIKHGWMYYPIISYSPETKTALGAGVGYFFREPGSAISSRPSTIMANFMYTQKKQIIAKLLTDTYWKNETYHITGKIGYLKFPDKFYGIGNDTSGEAEEDYTPENARVEMNFQVRVWPGLYFGPLYELYYSNLKEIEQDGLLAAKDVRGSEGGTASGAGVLMNWDTRNNIYSPSAGGFYQLSACLFSDDLGGVYNFNRYILDMRQYFPVFSSHVLAFQAYGRSMNGHPPFQLLSLLGGANKMRGYYEGRYRDNDMIVFQTEYRLPVWHRLGLAGFVGIGDVAGKISKFRLRDFKTSVGFGIRYLFVPKEKLNLRFDFGFGKNTSGFYINFMEAF